MKKNVLFRNSNAIFLLFFFFLFFTEIDAQNITITDDDVYTAHSSAMLDIKSDTKGLLIPRITTANRTTLAATAAEGLLVYDTDESALYYFSGGKWNNISKGQLWTVNNDLVLLSDSTARVGIGTYSPNSKLEVQADDSFTDVDTLFSVKDKNGNIVFAVFPDGAAVYVNETAKGKVGGFAVSGRNPSKATETEYMRVTPDSTRIWVNNDPAIKGKVGGFAVSGRNPSKGLTDDFMVITPDSTRIYINDTVSAKGKVGGFAVSGRNPSKGSTNQIILATVDSTRIFVEETANKGKVGGFAVSGRNPSKGVERDYFNISGNIAADVVNNEKRMMWYPTKAAFLAGEVHVGSSDSVGTNSTAIGYRNISMGNYSQAFGYKSFAIGTNSTAIGNNAMASAENSFAIGDSAVASGIGSYAFGSYGLDTVSGSPTNKQTIASGNYSFAFGFGSTAESVGSYAMGVNSSSIGDYAFAIGASNQANKKGSYAIGNLCVADGMTSFAIGYQDTASAVGSFAIGFNNDADTVGAFAIGNWNRASGESALAMGTGTKASGGYSTSFGFGSEASGTYSTAFGNVTEASGGSSTSLGWDTKAEGARSIAGGWATTASGNNSFAFGAGSVASGITSVAIGNLARADSTYATAFGASTKAQGHTSTAMGNTITVSGYSSFGIGLNATSYTVSQDNTFSVMGGYVGINTVSPGYALDVAGNLNIANGTVGAGAIVFRVDGDEALWYDGSVFSWGYGGTYNYFADNVSIGVSTGTYPLTVAGTANLNSGITSGTVLRANGAEAIYYTGSRFNWGSGGSYNYFPDVVGIGTTSTTASRLNISGTAPVVRITMSETDRVGQLIRFADYTGDQGNITINTGTISYNAFTGSHYAKVNSEAIKGMLIASDGTSTFLNNDPKSEIIYGASISVKPNSRNIIGAYLGKTDLEENDTYDLVMAVGNGVMWVVENGENIEFGDYLISSSIAGHAMKDKGEFDVSNIVARVAEPVDWSAETEMINGVKHKLISVFFENFTINNINIELRKELELMKKLNNELLERVELLEEMNK